MNEDVSLRKHAYLSGIAKLQELINDTAAEVVIPTAIVPIWSHYISDFDAGLPLLRSSAATIDLAPVEKALVSLLETLVSKPLPGRMAHEITDLMADLQSHSSAPRKAVAWLLEKDTSIVGHHGLLQYLGWTVMSRYLQKLVRVFGEWRDEERWLRGYCPMCGAPPAMAQLVGSYPGRLRLLSCGYCATRWRYRRTGCPFCETADDRRSAVLAIEGDAALRIDYCESCGGYLKTYNGEGSESALLADWTSLHLDFIAQDHGLKRYAASLYQL